MLFVSNNGPIVFSIISESVASPTCTIEQNKSSTASTRATGETFRTPSTPQPPVLRRKGSRSQLVDELFIREIVRLDKRRAEREDRRAERLEMRSTLLDEDDIFGQQVASIFKRFSRAQKSRARIDVLQLLESIEFSPTVGDPFTDQQYQSNQYDT